MAQAVAARAMAVAARATAAADWDTTVAAITVARLARATVAVWARRGQRWRGRGRSRQATEGRANRP